MWKGVFHQANPVDNTAAFKLWNICVHADRFNGIVYQVYITLVSICSVPDSVRHYAKLKKKKIQAPNVPMFLPYTFPEIPKCITCGLLLMCCQFKTVV